MVTEFSNQKDAGRYEMRVDVELAGFVDYRVLDGEISLTRTFTVPTFRGKGLAAKLVEYAVDDIARSGELRVAPICPYIAKWFDAHPEHSGLLRR
ncbi:hypothetical protein O159_25390 [Leifsonia xyli subsp. cynodontis DSM 46306]|jgi:hypothetical protein|uniref:Uncharacterized protein n=1 Tax=Leifsonia xyli subsp. cynodontis DSM 46306 TaxID=1389489 RepID=U3P9H2_LEIXC|nr:GNAT family N-acetyltransferase [Leifsonia xyli]AGW42471.1 hypothetical protein O159_25390 [Leifsonia xyli subsp. cynodontis DSM 46306]